MCFKRPFVALRPCIDGFLAGCRPYIGVDASILKGKYTGQLASATSVDGHNWLYYVAYGIFHSETEENWVWFMEQLHRECMRHLYGNFMKQYQGDVFTDHLYPAARAYTEWLFKWHISKIYEVAPDAIVYLKEHHNRLWYRCGFSEASKCDYLTNNVSESFNSQVRHLKGLLLHELVDGIRELIMEKRYLRKQIANKMDDGILPNVMKELNQVSNNLRVVKVARSDEDCAEVTLVDAYNNTRRHTVDLKNHNCSCRVWQVTGKPCHHALAWILSNRGV
jgi:hypothetical protein